MNCQVCNKDTLVKFLSLGHQPPSDAFLKKEELNKPETFYPLETFFCENCSLVQLGYAVDPDVLFKDYVYNTGTNNSLIKNFQELVDKLVSKFNLSSNDLAIDIGSNDGTLLKGYLKHNVKVLGIEPSNISEIAIKQGIPTINRFFNKETAEEVSKKHGKPKIITATNVFAHVKDINSFVEGVKILLDEGGVFVQESHYLLNLINKMQWDSIYHEHLRYYSLRSLQFLFNCFDMEIFDAEEISTHGGSIRTYACKKGKRKISDNVIKILKNEEENNLHKKETYFDYGKKVFKHKLQIQENILNIKKEGKKIVGIGAPAKGNTLLNYCNFDSKIIDYIVEKSELKIKTYTPGTHIEVLEESRLFEEQPDYGFLLSWNIEKELIPKLRKSGFKGKFIIPLPDVHFID